MSIATRLAAIGLALIAGLSSPWAAEKAIIILDGSGSMWAQIDGEARISIARDTLGEVLDAVPEDLELGFMSYGHRVEGACDDIELMVAPAPNTADAIREAAAEITPLGKTPLSDAVRIAAEDLAYLEEKATVILITDGIESCEADPCALAADLESRGVDFTTHVVGFGLSDEEGQAVACLAENTGGTYFQASDGDALAEALTRTVTQVAATPEPVPEPAAPEFNFMPVATLAEGGDPLPRDAGNAWEIYRATANTDRGEYLSTDYGNAFRTNLEPGDYIVVARLGEASVEQPVTIVSDEVAAPTLVLDAGTVTIRPRPSPDADIDTGAAVEFRLPDGSTSTGYGEVTQVLPAGDQEVTVRLGEGVATDSFALAAGEVIARDVVVGVGRASVNAAYVEGMRVEDGGLFVEVFGAKKALDGSRKSFSYGYGPDNGFDLPPGDYVLVAKIGGAEAEVPFAVAVGELSEVTAVLGAGVLAISAPGYDFVEVFGPPDIAGNRKSFAYNYGGALQTTLPAGDYTIVVQKPNGGDKAEAPASVAAGERAEVTVE